jgi:arylformamidase
MTAGWSDISVALVDELPTWPGSPGVSAKLRMAISRGDDANVTQLNIDVHSGTHVDAPRHLIDQGDDVEQLGLDPFIGPAIVLDTGSAKEITASVLETATIPAGTERLLLRTANSLGLEMYERPFDEEYAALTVDGAEWLAAQGLRLVGIDYLSIQRYSEPADVHILLLGAGISLLEGLRLVDIAPGAYELICLPMRLVNAEGAPARAIVRPLTPMTQR